AKKYDLPLINCIDDNGHFEKLGVAWDSFFIKKADSFIIENLKQRDRLAKAETIQHTYPFCWRCESPVYDYLFSSWFVKVTSLKKELLENNQKIAWVPEHLKNGRFGKWLEGARDWNVSRNRFWGTPLPVWRCQTEKCDTIVFDSIAELEKLSNKKIDDLHKPYIDEITIRCEKCNNEMKRTSEVFDCWFESGSMPYAERHYPFENQDEFKKNFPADFIAEGLDQTRGWFYTLHVLSTALFNKPAFKNVIVNGLILAEDGKKMSKRLKNYPEPEYIMEKFGADALRLYLLSGSVVEGEELRFSEKNVAEYWQTINTFYNVYNFWSLFKISKDQSSETLVKEDKQLIDQWIENRLEEAKEKITKAYENYLLKDAVAELKNFINDFSTWYIRLNRDRFKEYAANNDSSLSNFLAHILYETAQLLAPICPFITEHIYQNGIKEAIGEQAESIHLTQWPSQKNYDQKILEEMAVARRIAEIGWALRKKAQIPAKQKLNALYVEKNIELNGSYLKLVADELNIAIIELVDTNTLGNNGQYIKKETEKLKIFLDIQMTDELKEEGIARELTRIINNERKKRGLNFKDTFNILYDTEDEGLKKIIEKHKEKINKNTSSALNLKDSSVLEDGTEISIGDSSLRLWII
ncbi:MAG: class I tRNA ligase family protein, partial [Parcubacteria group bacterium]|nr:class I tRNA ligase family protein [Parcubacteria group bacterium]